MNARHDRLARKLFAERYGARRYRRMLDLATSGGLARVDFELFARFARETTVSVPDTADAITALFRACHVHEEPLTKIRVPIRHGPKHAGKLCDAHWLMFPFAERFVYRGPKRQPPDDELVLSCRECRRVRDGLSVDSRS